ncbi:DUF1232 domain-containing protein [Candidatus Electronema halotolerans]
MAAPPLNPFFRALGMVKHAWAVFRAKDTPRYVKLVFGLGLLYIVSPWDLIPEWIPVIGLMDDLTLAALLVAWANGFKVDGEE